MSRIAVAIDSNNNVHQSMLQEFCTAIELTESSHPAEANMRYTGWESNPASLFHLIYKEQRLSSPEGQYFILNDDSRTIAGSGVYIKEDIAILLVRTWTLPEFRSLYLLHEYLLPLQLEWAKSRAVESAMITVNEYNKKLLIIFRRAMNSENHPMSKWYKNAIISSEPEIINHIPQWTVKFKLS